MRLDIVDVFAERRLAGNQLAVVRDAGHLATDDMQAIAREMNFSETTFVTEVGDRRARVRIFTPGWELPFAGHPTIGTAWVLAGGRGEYTLDLDAGAVPVSFEDGIGWMVPPDVRFTGEVERYEAAALIGLTVRELHGEFAVRLAEVGPRFVLIGVSGLAALKEARLDNERRKALVERGVGADGIFVFTTEPYTNEADLAARMFFESAGVREDPATGSANTALAASLREIDGTARSLVVDQGVEMGRPSRIYLEIGDVLRVGGKVQHVVAGTMVG